MPRVRTFLAIELDAPTHDFIAALAQSLHAEMPGVRFVSSETWHLTLAFLGELDEVAVTAAQEAAQSAASQIPPFTLHATGIGTFGKPTTPRIIWVGLGGDHAALVNLQQQVVHDLDQQHLHHDGFFSPHITLARPRQPLSDVENAALQAAMRDITVGPAMPVTHISVMRSDLSSAGARYTCLFRAPLATE